MGVEFCGTWSPMVLFIGNELSFLGSWELSVLLSQRTFPLIFHSEVGALCLKKKKTFVCVMTLLSLGVTSPLFR